MFWGVCHMEAMHLALWHGAQCQLRLTDVKPTDACHTVFAVFFVPFISFFHFDWSGCLHV